MKRLHLILFILIIGFLMFIVGCSKTSSVTNSGDSQNQKIEELTKKVSDLDSKTAKIKELENQVSLLKALQDGDSKVALDPSTTGYRKIETDTGIFYVSIIKSEPYLDGVKVDLNMGNPMYVNYSGLDLKVRYGKKWELFIDDAKKAEWEKGIKEKEIKVSNQITAGHWNTVTLILPGINPADFRYLELSITTDNINMLQ